MEKGRSKPQSSPIKGNVPIRELEKQSGSLKKETLERRNVRKRLLMEMSHRDERTTNLGESKGFSRRGRWAPPAYLGKGGKTQEKKV